MRKRRNRGTWIPVLGHRIQDSDAEYVYSDFDIGFTQVPTSNALGGVQPWLLPIVPDQTEETPAVGQPVPNLHDRVAGNAWLLQRIVGKFHLCCVAGAAPGSASDIWNNILVTCGLFVARSTDDNQFVCDLLASEADPQQVDNSANPWIWRRSWILGNPSGDGQQYPQRNTGMYGSLADGPHIDSKVKRRIEREHRLWLVVQARGFDPRVLIEVGGPAINQPALGGIIDLRVFGSLRRSRNSSSF